MNPLAPRTVARAGALAAVASATALTACGGAGALSRSGYAARADAICQAIAPPGPKPSTAGQAASYARQQAEGRAAALTRLRRLRPPGSISPAVKRFVDASQATVDDFRAMARAAQQNDRAGFALAGLSQAVHAVDRTHAASDAGLTVCGQATRPLPDAALVANADAACRAADQAILARPASARGADVAGLAVLVPTAYPAVLDSLHRLQTLQPNPASEAPWGSFLSVYEQRVRATNDAVTAAHAGDRAGLRAAVSRDGTLAGEESGLAAQLGLELCGTVGALGV